MSGQREPLAVALLGLGAGITLLAGIQLLRLNEDSLTYDSTLRWDWDWNEKTRQGWSGEGRFMAGLRDWIAERQMTRADAARPTGIAIAVVADMPMARENGRGLVARPLDSRCPALR